MLDFLRKPLATCELPDRGQTTPPSILEPAFACSSIYLPVQVQCSALTGRLSSMKCHRWVLSTHRLALNVILMKYKLAATCDFQQFGILTSANSDELVQPFLKLRISK